MIKNLETHKTRGLVLVAVLWVVMLLTVMVTVLAREVRLDSRISMATGEQSLQRWLSRAGLEQATALLNEDLNIGDNLNDIWNDNPDDCNDIVLEGGVFTIEITDQAGNLNINTATRQQLLALPDMTEDIADAIIDWRDTDDEVSGKGAESGYYSNLPFAYKIRNGPFRTVRELLLVKGLPEELLYGQDMDGDGRLDRGWLRLLTCYSYDMNTDTNGNERVNINEADESKLKEKLEISQSYAKWIVENRQSRDYQSISDLINKDSPKEAQGDSENSDEAKPIDLKTFADIVDRITVRDPGRIEGLVNINTANELVLAAVFEGDRQKARKIIDYRRSLSDGMTNIAQVMQAAGIDVDDFKKIASSITIRTNVFGVKCFGQTNLTEAKFQSADIVDRTRRPAEVLYHYQGVAN